jgi:HK97 gp10 family phage protein
MPLKQQQWNGDRVLQQWLGQIDAGLEDEAAEILDDLKSSIHVVTGEMRDMAVSRLEVRGADRALVIGSDSEHAAYEEFGTSRRPAHPVIREVADQHFPHVGEKIQKARPS